MASRILLACAGGLLFSSPILAQAVMAQTAPAIPNPPPAVAAPAAPTTSQAPAAPSPAATTAPDSYSEADAKFVSDARAAGIAEVEMGRLAASKAESDGVRQFGEIMANDHGKANVELNALSRQQAPVTDGMTPGYQRAHDRLAGLSGPRFDRRYIAGQVREHEKAVRLFERQAASGQDPRLRQFAADKLPTLKQHLQMAQSLSSTLPPPAQSRLNNTAPATGGARRTAPAPEAYTADLLNEAEYQRVRNAAGGGAMAATGMPRAVGPCASDRTAAQAARAATAPGSQPDTTKSPDANVAEQRLRAAGYC